MVSCEIISVGTELLLGDIVNTDAAFLSKKLAELGLPLYRQSVVGDNAERLSSALREASLRSDVIILTGGLGPNCAEITKNVVADVFNRPLVTDRNVVCQIKAYFDNTGRPMSENNLSQALVPEGATVLENRNGTAPGIFLRAEATGIKGEKTVILLPGPPRELIPMFNEEVIPLIKDLSPYIFSSVNLHLFGIGESAAESILREIMEKSENPTVAPYAAEAEVRIRVTARGASREECESLCKDKIDEIRRTDVGKYIFAESTSDEDSADVLVRRVISALRENNMTVATAESCTAGMISSRIADIPGSSDVLLGGIVSYSNDVKMNVLGVSAETIKNHGAVSEECAVEMAEGARTLTGADIAISVTGVAGPGGGSAEKPVGTVCFGIADRHGVSTETRHFGTMRSRGQTRRHTTSTALIKILERIEKI